MEDFNITMAVETLLNDTLFVNGTLPPELGNGDSIGQNAMDNSKSAKHSPLEFFIGLSLAIISCLFIGSSFILKKKALLRLAARDENHRASAGGYGYLKQWLWWLGILSMAVGEGCNFCAYIFAPASLVTPLGVMSVLVAAVLSAKVLKEKLNLLGKIGCTVCLLGSCMIIIHSPKEDNVNSMEELAEKMQEPAFLVYVAIMVLASLFLMYYVAPKHGPTNILVYLAICSMIGALSVLGCKGLGLAIKETASGKNQFVNGLTYFWLLSLIVCMAVELNYLNKALDIFNTAMVTPIHYCMFTSFAIMATGILFNEWVKLSAMDIFGNVCGFSVTIIGLAQMQLFKHVNVTLYELRHYIWKRHDDTTTSPRHRTCSGSPPLLNRDRDPERHSLSQDSGCLDHNSTVEWMHNNSRIANLNNAVLSESAKGLIRRGRLAPPENNMEEEIPKLERFLNFDSTANSKVKRTWSF